MSLAYIDHLNSHLHTNTICENTRYSLSAWNKFELKWFGCEGVSFAFFAHTQTIFESMKKSVYIHMYLFIYNQQNKLDVCIVLLKF